MVKKRIALMAMAVTGLLFSSQAATSTLYTSTLEKNATSLSASSSIQTKKVTLTRATEDGKTYKYLRYYKMTLKKSTAYTVWLTGDDVSAGKVSIRACYGKESLDWNVNAPVATFEKIDCGVETRYLVSGKKWSSKDEWEDMDWAGDSGDIDWGKTTTPSSWTYYIVVEGSEDSSATINYIAKEKVPNGVSAKPLVIKPSNKIQTKTLTDGFMSDYYYIQVACKAGYCYRFGTVGGTSANALSFVENDFLYGTVADFGSWASAYNGAKSFYSNQKQTLTLRIKSEMGYKATGKIRFYVEKQKAIGSHAATGTLNVGKSLTAVPGYLNKPAEPTKGYFDMIVDEQLFKISLKKSKNYVIETSGADAKTPLAIYLYDKKGNVLQQNLSKGSESQDVRIAYTPTSSTTYYVGVCEQHGLFDEFNPKKHAVTLSAKEVSTIAKTVKVLPVPAKEKDLPKVKDSEGSEVIALGANCWYATGAFAGTKDVTYTFSIEFDDATNVESNKLSVEIYKTKVASKNKVKSLTVEPGETFSLAADTSAMHYLRIWPEAGKGLDFKPFRIHATGYYYDGTACGAIKVTLTGAKGQWAQVSYVNGEKAKTLATRKKNAVRYDSGTSVIVPVGEKRVFFTDVKGYTTPSEVRGTVTAGATLVLGDLYYTDKWDPKDDVTSKATSLSISSSTKKVTTHTLWKTDSQDCYYFTAKQGYYYTFKVDGGTGDQVLTLKRIDGEVFAEDVKSVTRILLPKTTNTKYKKTPAKYYLIVSHATDDNIGGKYTLSSRFENLGVVKFSKSTYSATDSSTSVELSVSRTVSKGAVRVRYETIDGTAKDGTQYYAQGGYLSWKEGDKSAKKIVVKLIPKTLPLKGKNLSFKVKLTDASEDEVEDGLSQVLAAVFNGAKTSLAATVTIANKAKYKDVKSAYASVYKDKKTTLKTQESASLRTGTFYGLVQAQGNALASGASEFGALTLTVSAGKKSEEDKISAKVQVAGATYSFASSVGWDGTDGAGRLVKTLRAVSSVNPSQTNELTVTARDAKTATWKTNSVCTAVLNLCLPNGAGSRKVSYEGELYRRNTKIQAYLDAAFKFDGYYTMSLVPAAGDLTVGNGYLTVTLDANGGAKVAGLLPDNSKVSASATGCAIVPCEESVSGWAMLVPVYQADAKGCLAAVLRFFMQTDKGRVDGKQYKIVVKSSERVFWNRDDGVNRDGSRGWRRQLVPCGGWYDKLVNLQGYYSDLASAFALEVTGDFPKELLQAGYEVVAKPAAVVNLSGNVLSAEKRKLVASQTTPSQWNFEESVNPCNVTIAIKRATGVTTGKGSVWTSNGELQSEVTGFTHFGVLTLDRDDACGLDPDVLIYGALVKPVTLVGGTWMFSVPLEVYGY